MITITVPFPISTKEPIEAAEITQFSAIRTWSPIVTGKKATPL
jgi:hypothetical protein